MFTDRNILYVTATLSPDLLFGYAKVKSDNNKTGFLVFHYGAETNLRKLPNSRSAVFPLSCLYKKTFLFSLKLRTLTESKFSLK